jgi:uncharacterized membrane protein
MRLLSDDRVAPFTGGEAMIGADTGLTRHDMWRHLTEEEHRILHAVLQRPPVPRDAATADEDHVTIGQRLADRVTNKIGSWPFIIVQSVLLLIWIVVNTIAWRQHWDPYPFILLNLVLSFQAAYAAPIIMMSQNRQSAKDREKAEVDYAVNARAERDVAAVHARLDELAGLQWATLVDMQQQQLELLTRIEGLTQELQRVAIPHDPVWESARQQNS